MSRTHGENPTKADQSEVLRFFPDQREPEIFLLEGRPSLLPPLLTIAVCTALVGISGIVVRIIFARNLFALLVGSVWMLCLLWLAVQGIVELGRRINTKFTLTQKNLFVQSGVLQRRNKTLLVGRIQDVVIEQEPLGLVFHYGKVRVETAGERGGLVLQDAPNPLKWRAAILMAAAAALRGRSSNG